MKPATYQPYDLRQEQPSSMLWLFEGFTAYFDNWLLQRSGVISRPQYLKLLEEDISSYLRRRGHRHQTLANSSFEAWTKLYNGGEDAINSSTTYYIQGALFALCLDGFLKQYDDGLPALIRALWHKFRQDGEGLSEERFIAFVCARLPADAQAAFLKLMQQGLHSVEVLPLSEAFAAFGLSLELVPKADASSSPGFGWRSGHGFFVTALDEHSPAACAGLAVEDELVALNHERVTAKILEQTLMQSRPDAQVTAHVFRDGILHKYSFTLMQAAHELARLTVNEHADDAQKARREKWLNPVVAAE